MDMYAFHLDVPDGARRIEVSLEYLAPNGGQFTAGPSTTDHLMVLSWHWVLLSPPGANDDIVVEASLRLPAGWKFGTALTVAGSSGGLVDFAPASLATLVDSPVLAGEHFRTITLSTAKPPVEVAIAGDSEPALAARPEFIAYLRKLVDEAGALFGARHYDHYTFLLTLSDQLPSSGLEHHQSSDNRVGEQALIDEAVGRQALEVLSHEYVHSWNGKYRRPAGLATPDFQTPMEGELLWVYEGLTQYYGKVLAARSGLWNAPQYRDALAQIAASLDHVPGRAWRPLIDTSGDSETFVERYGEAGEHNVIQFLAFDAENLNSIYSCLRGARENARSVREIISSEMWLQLNQFYLMVNSAALTTNGHETPHDFFTEVKLASHLFAGVTDSTMNVGLSASWSRLE